jgi:glycosyltransferase involved in cell wall biosynthesis
MSITADNTTIRALRGAHVLLVSPEPWKGIQLSKHDVARALVARGNSVCFLGPPRSRKLKVSVTGEYPLQAAHYRHWLRGANYLPRAVHSRYYAGLIASLEQATGKPFDIIWCFDTSRMQWFPDHPAFRILHCADHDILKTHPADGLVETADAVLTVTEAIRTELQALAPGKPMFNTGHMIEGNWFAPGVLHTPPARPKNVAYAGQLRTDYIDWEVLRAIIEGAPDMHFHFYGPYDRSYPARGMTEVLDQPNITLHGLVPKEQLVHKLNQADILLLCYREYELGEIVWNSHKMLEYFATGKPIAASWTQEYAAHGDLLCMPRERWQLPERFARLVADYPAHTAKALCDARIALARSRSIATVLEQLSTEFAALPVADASHD